MGRMADHAVEPGRRENVGIRRPQAIGRPCCDLFVGYDDSGNRLCYQGCHVASLVKLGDAVQTFDMRTRTKAGRPIWVNLSTLTVPAGQTGGPLTVHLFRDVTATKELLGLVQERPPGPAGRAGARRAHAPRSGDLADDRHRREHDGRRPTSST